MPNSKHILAIDNGASADEGSLLGTQNSISTWKMGYTQYNNIYKLDDVVRPVQHSHRLCCSGACPTLTTISLSRSSLNVNNGI
ncbi:hypothetical protein E5676_scaffold318G00780 [Cucumis melo var. makuwa]|uniref:Uncharacterized protein n=1 Tax=Cucumis melo var. makuwa TaxID=1194695 RepID=A0A5D3DEI2_CUCMM|nr:hypothetical protein E6C27_scaffold22G001290 [Cucumis melo var. makuwa]TYK22091.1 hypothetical protein E5676_scaffold318G00780 [Cucumis melo var. makuwa]